MVSRKEIKHILPRKIRHFFLECDGPGPQGTELPSLTFKPLDRAIVGLFLVVANAD
mgnify:CR=1 FL=1